MNPTFASELVRDFLNDPASISEGVPANNVLIKQALTDTATAPPPRLVVEVKPEPSDTPSERRASLAFALMLTMESRPGNRAQAETWLETIRARLLDRPAFAAWIVANRTEQQRTGWQIKKLTVYKAEEDFESNDEEKTFTLVLPLRLDLRIAA